MSELDDLLDPGVRAGSQTSQSRVLPNSTAVLVLGIISIVACIFYGLPGLICGIIALSLHKKDKTIYASDPSSYEASFKNSRAGYICAIIGTSLSAIYFVVAIFAIAFAVNVGRF